MTLTATVKKGEVSFGGFAIVYALAALLGLTLYIAVYLKSEIDVLRNVVRVQQVQIDSLEKNKAWRRK